MLSYKACSIPIPINKVRLHQFSALILALVLIFRLRHLRRRRRHIVDVKENVSQRVFLIGQEDVDLGDVLVLAQLFLVLRKEIPCGSTVRGTC